MIHITGFYSTVENDTESHWHNILSLLLTIVGAKEEFSYLQIIPSESLLKLGVGREDCGDPTSNTSHIWGHRNVFVESYNENLATWEREGWMKHCLLKIVWSLKCQPTQNYMLLLSWVTCQPLISLGESCSCQRYTTIPSTTGFSYYLYISYKIWNIYSE